MFSDSLSDIARPARAPILESADRDPGRAYLAARIQNLYQRLRDAVSFRRRGDPAPDDPLRGLYLTDETLDWILQREDLPTARDFPTADQTARAYAEKLADDAEQAGHEVGLRRLARNFGLLEVDIELLLVALLPELDPRVEQMLGYLNDDVTRRRPSVGLALDLCGLCKSSGSARARLAAGSPLLQGGLVDIEDKERPFLGRALRVPDRVVSHLLGVDIPEELLTELLLEAPPEVGLPETPGLARAIAAGARLICLRDTGSGPGRTLAAEALAAAGFAVLPVDLSRLTEVKDDNGAALQALVREALLLQAGIVAAIPVAAATQTSAIVRALSRAPIPVLLITHSWWDPSWSNVPPLHLDVAEFQSDQREALWRNLIGADDLALRAASPFRLSPDAVVRAAAEARAEAAYRSTAVTAEHVRQGARSQNAAGLERLARRISPQVGWDDLVLPEMLLGQLREIALRARHREQVLGQWRMRPGGGRGRGVAALFAGDSGTGKTMSAEVIAGDLGLDLYTVDLATVVDKYVGETEKNLERIFSQAADINGVLFFDEADAVFGKRSDVKDAHDRYANIESAYLLQRMESFDGLVILATNLRSNLDDAFTRRLDLLLDFPKPDQAQRRAIWQRCLSGAVPCDPDLDIDYCARTFDVAGGSIRSAAVTAAYLAAGEGRRLGMPHLVEAMQSEYRKMGRLVLNSQFQGYRR